VTSPQPSYQQRTEANAATSATQAATIVAAYRAGQIERPELPHWLTTSIRIAAARAVAMADSAVSDYLATTIGRPVPVVGLVLPPATVETITAGVETVLDQDDTIEPRVERLATAAPLDAGQTAHQEAMERQGVEAWTRETDSTPCNLCQALADGTVIPIRKTMIRHPGCSCVAVPVLTGAEPKQPPESGPDDPAAFQPRTLTTGHGLYGRSYTQVRPGLKVSRSVFIPSLRAR